MVLLAPSGRAGTGRAAVPCTTAASVGPPGAAADLRQRRWVQPQLGFAPQRRHTPKTSPTAAQPQLGEGGEAGDGPDPLPKAPAGHGLVSAPWTSRSHGGEQLNGTGGPGKGKENEPVLCWRPER